MKLERFRKCWVNRSNSCRNMKKVQTQRVRMKRVVQLKKSKVKVHFTTVVRSSRISLKSIKDNNRYKTNLIRKHRNNWNKGKSVILVLLRVLLQRILWKWLVRRNMWDIKVIMDWIRVWIEW